MELNIVNGILKVHSMVFKPLYRLDEFLKSEHKPFETVKRSEFAGWCMYSLLPVDKNLNTLGLGFELGVLKNISINLTWSQEFPPFEITSKKKVLVKEILTAIGGEREYTWGKVEYVEDFKGGSVFVLIKYKDSIN